MSQDTSSRKPIGAVSFSSPGELGISAGLPSTPQQVNELAPQFYADLREILTGHGDRTTLLDVYFAYRLILGRPPESAAICHQQARAGLKALSGGILRSTEYRMTDSFGIVAPEIPVMAVTPDGLRVYFYLRDCFVGWHMAAGNYDLSQAQVIKQHVKAGSRCIDLGANIGAFTLQMGAQAGPRGAVYAFEPFPKNFRLLQRNVEANAMGGWVKLFPAAAHSSSGRIRLFFDRVTQSDFWAAFVSAREQPVGFDSIEVEQVRLDDVIPTGEKIDLIKMDIEGAELAAVKGMQRILAESRPLLLFEFNPPTLRSAGGVDPEALLERLRALSYRITRLETFSAGECGAFIYRPEIDANEVVNLVAVP